MHVLIVCGLLFLPASIHLLPATSMPFSPLFVLVWSYPFGVCVCTLVQGCCQMRVPQTFATKRVDKIKVFLNFFLFHDLKIKKRIFVKIDLAYLGFVLQMHYSLSKRLCCHKLTTMSRILGPKIRKTVYIYRYFCIKVIKLCVEYGKIKVNDEKGSFYITNRMAKMKFLC